MRRPAERLVRRKDTRHQFAFALEAKSMLPRCDASVLAASNSGLHVLAQDDAGLVARLRDLREAYGFGIEAAPCGPQSREEPLMSGRIGLQKRDLPAVRRVLADRAVRPSEEYAGTHYCVLGFEAPFAALLGLPRKLAALTGGTATHLFQPVFNRLPKRRTQDAFSHRYPDRLRAPEPAR